jgi:hypothetical protein
VPRGHHIPISAYVKPGESGGSGQMTMRMVARTLSRSGK